MNVLVVKSLPQSVPSRQRRPGQLEGSVVVWAGPNADGGSGGGHPKCQVVALDRAAFRPAPDHLQQPGRNVCGGYAAQTVLDQKADFVPPQSPCLVCPLALGGARVGA